MPFLPELLGGLAAEGLAPEIRTVPYEFQRDADQMLVIDAR